MKINSNIFLLIIISVLYVNSFSKFLTKFSLGECTKQSISPEELNSIYQQFSKIINRDTLQQSSSDICYESNCRQWEETKKIAFCKALLVSKSLQTRRVELLKVKYKTESLGEYSDFLFEIPSTNTIFNGFLKSSFPTKIVFRMCIPVDRTSISYVDINCPHEKCGSFGIFNLI